MNDDYLLLFYLFIYCHLSKLFATCNRYFNFFYIKYNDDIFSP